MGFQFNHVGGGTKTRRPITIHMKYNASCVEPHCFLLREDNVEIEQTLSELQVREETGGDRPTAFFARLPGREARGAAGQNAASVPSCDA